MTQSKKDSAPENQLTGEIDIMPYYKNNELGVEYYQPNYHKRRVAAEKDVFSLLWLTKIKIQ